MNKKNNRLMILALLGTLSIASSDARGEFSTEVEKQMEEAFGFLKKAKTSTATNIPSAKIRIVVRKKYIVLYFVSLLVIVLMTLCIKAFLSPP